MKRKQSVDKVVPFTQSETNTKTFRLDLPVSDELKEVLVNDVINDLMRYTIALYSNEYLPMLEEFADDHFPKKEKQPALVHNLFWWRMFYDISNDFRDNFIEAYISKHYYSQRKRPIQISWLRECKKVIPKFYYVGHKYNDRTLVLVDILDEKPLKVVIFDPLAIPPQEGTIVMGTLLPLGDGLFFPITDFYHFDYKARKEIAACIHHYYNKHLKNSSKYEAFIHVLSAMLQIERLVTVDQLEYISSK
jgi:hypothetical protein